MLRGGAGRGEVGEELTSGSENSLGRRQVTMNVGDVNGCLAEKLTGRWLVLMMHGWLQFRAQLESDSPERANAGTGVAAASKA